MVTQFSLLKLEQNKTSLIKKRLCENIWRRRCRLFCRDRLNSLLELTFSGDSESIVYCFINSIKSKYNDTLGTINSSSEFSTKNFELFIDFPVDSEFELHMQRLQKKHLSIDKSKYLESLCLFVHLKLCGDDLESLDL